MIPTASPSESSSALALRRPSLQVALSPDDRRFQRLGENHHLWRNGRFWWIAYTVIIDGWRQERIRHSLKTDDLTEARVRRDEILATVSSEGVLAPRELIARHVRRRVAVSPDGPRRDAQAGT